jgi:cytochrome c-type biogenesis protein CcmH
MLLLALLGAAMAQAQAELGVQRTTLGPPQGRPLAGEELDRVTEEISSIMRCPVCQGLSVADSPTLSAIAMKAEVRQFLAAGYTRTQILDYFERSYGEFIRLEPKAKGFNLTVWIAPVAATLLGLALIVMRWRRSQPSVVADPGDREADLDLEEYRQRVRREVTP